MFLWTCRGTDSLKELCRSTALIQRLEQLLHDPEIPVQQVNIAKLFMFFIQKISKLLNRNQFQSASLAYHGCIRTTSEDQIEEQATTAPESNTS
jgi:hypothetical protein